MDNPGAKLATVTSSSSDTLEIALEWLNLINDSQLKSKTTQRVIENWYEYAPQDALDYLEQTQALSNAQKQKLSEYFD